MITLIIMNLFRWYVSKLNTYVFTLIPLRVNITIYYQYLYHLPGSIQLDENEYVFFSPYFVLSIVCGLATPSHLGVLCVSINSTSSSKLDVLHTPIFGSDRIHGVETKHCFCCLLCNEQTGQLVVCIWLCNPETVIKRPRFLFAWCTNILRLNTFRNELTGCFNQSQKPASLAKLNLKNCTFRLPQSVFCFPQYN